MSQRFKKAIIAVSDADTWYDAIGEWLWESVKYDEGQCICGVHITEQHHLTHRADADRRIIIGNVCIKQFERETLERINIRRNIINCDHCDVSKPFNTKVAHCAAHTLECICGGRKRNRNMITCMECRICPMCKFEKERERWGNKETMCSDCEYEAALDAAPPCICCGRRRTYLHDESCKECTTVIGFGKYRNLTPPQLLRRDPSYVNWVCNNTNRTELIKTLNAIRAKNSK